MARSADCISSSADAATSGSVETPTDTALPGTVIGDSGVAVALEARYGSFIPANTESFVFQPFVFFDAALEKVSWLLPVG